jgi:Cof subfamily protein (haloacid dehalogenase superfamily)
MGKFSGVLIVTDLDGTLLNSNKHVDAESREAIEYFMANGGYFTFATGRLYQSFQNVRKRVVQNAPVIFSNGAQIYDLESEKLLWECGLDGDIEPLCEEILRKFPGTAAEVYRHKKCDTINENEITEKHIRDFEIERTIRTSFSEIEKPWIKVLFTNETALLKEIADYINEKYDKANAKFSAKHFLEVFSGKTDKGRGTLRLAEMLGVATENIYTVGDQENDIDLLSAASVSFAPENAVPEVKKYVDVILPDNDHNTIAAMISHIDKLY